MTRFVLCTLGCFVGSITSTAGNDSAGPIEICKAAIATVMDRDPSIMRTKLDGEVIQVEYVLREGGAVWGYRCRLEGLRIMWASAKGQWNTHPKDPVITFELFGDKREVAITERHGDGSRRVKRFPLSRLQ